MKKKKRKKEIKLFPFSFRKQKKCTRKFRREWLRDSVSTPAHGGIKDQQQWACSYSRKLLFLSSFYGKKILGGYSQIL